MQEVLDNEAVPLEEQSALVLEDEEKILREELSELARDAARGEESIGEVDESQKSLLQSLLKDEKFVISLRQDAIVDPDPRDETKVSFAPKGPALWQETISTQFGGESKSQTTSDELVTVTLPAKGRKEWINHVVRFRKGEECEVSLQVEVIREYPENNQMAMSISTKTMSKTYTDHLSESQCFPWRRKSWYELQEWTLGVYGNNLERREVSATGNLEWHQRIERSTMGEGIAALSPPTGNIGLKVGIGATKTYEIRGTEWDLKASFHKKARRDGVKFSWSKWKTPYAKDKPKPLSINELNGSYNLADFDSKQPPVAKFKCKEGRVRLELNLQLRFLRKGKMLSQWRKPEEKTLLFVLAAHDEKGLDMKNEEV